MCEEGSVVYNSSPYQTFSGKNLMIRFEEVSNKRKDDYGWATLQSMRNVDWEIELGTS